jgi:ABC-type branched-subunit amino acid transport system substrate-binding protein
MHHAARRLRFQVFMFDSDRDQLLDRRTFLHAASMYVGFIAFGSRTISVKTPTAPDLRVGMILPQRDTGAGADVIAGIELGIDEAGRSAALFQKRVTLARKTFASARDAGSAATSLVLDEHATILIGGGSDDECRAIADVCTKHSALFINVVSRSDELRRSICTKFLTHVEASDAMYASAHKIASAQTDSTAPADCDVVLWHSSLERYGASQLNDRFNAKSHRPMTGSSWAGWMAVKAATESFFRAGANDGDSIATYMSSDTTQFDGHKGAPLSFRSWDHQLRQPLYCVASEAKPGSPIARDIPDLSRSSRPARELLDELGDDKTAGHCSGVAP